MRGVAGCLPAHAGGPDLPAGRSSHYKALMTTPPEEVWGSHCTPGGCGATSGGGGGGMAPRPVNPRTNQELKGPGLTLPLGTDATTTSPVVTTSEVCWQEPGPSAGLRASEPEPKGRQRVGPAGPLGHLLLLNSRQQSAVAWSSCCGSAG